MEWESCYETPVEVEAHVVKGFLEHYGVPCVLASDRFQAQPLTFCALGQVRVLVPEDWAHVARGLINGRGKKGRRTPTARRRSRSAQDVHLKAAPRRSSNG
jgi:Putative prokaryotic signal transducing protein